MALVVNQNQAAFWVDGSVAGSVATPDGPGATRAFFSDIEGINFMAIGLHKDRMRPTPSVETSMIFTFTTEPWMHLKSVFFTISGREGIRFPGLRHWPMPLAPLQ